MSSLIMTLVVTSTACHRTLIVLTSGLAKNFYTST